MIADQLRPRHYAVDDQGSEDDGHRDAPRDAEGERRDECGLRAGVVGRLRSGDALDRSPAETARIFRDPLLDGIADEGGDSDACTRQRTEKAADPGPAQHWRD